MSFAHYFSWGIVQCTTTVMQTRVEVEIGAIALTLKEDDICLSRNMPCVRRTCTLCKADCDRSARICIQARVNNSVDVVGLASTCPDMFLIN